MQTVDLQKRASEKGGAGTKRDGAPEKEKATAGFPRVEALIDEYTTAAQAKDVLSESVAQLDGLLANEKNHKKKADIVKARRSFELTLDTLDYLFQVKTELTKAATSQQGQR